MPKRFYRSREKMSKVNVRYIVSDIDAAIPFYIDKELRSSVPLFPKEGQGEI